MGEMSKPSTVHFEPDPHPALRMKAAATHWSKSEIVNEVVRLALREDRGDLQAFEDRDGKAFLSCEDLLNDLIRRSLNNA